MSNEPLVRGVRRIWTVRLPRRYAQFPYVGLVLANTVLVVVAVGTAAPILQAAVLTTVLVTALVVGRQVAAYREKAELLRVLGGHDERLQHEATHDALTGLANRGLFAKRLDLALGDGDGDDVCVLLIDLDDFKAVNDTLGHAVGDRLLKAVTEVVSTATGPTDLPVRLGGDEFAVLLTGARAGGGCPEAVAQRLLHGLSRPVLVGEHRLLVQASIGMAMAQPGADDNNVLRNADIAMHTAKQRGKARFVRYASGMAEPVLADLELAGDLRRALEEGDLRLDYQAVVGLADGHVFAVESLVRWRHPTRGQLSPGEFIPIAERTGLIVPLGRWALRETCRQLAKWSADYGPLAPYKAGVNVSAHQLHDPGFADEVAATVREAGLEPDRIVLELTESAALRGRQILRTLHELHAAGVMLALDDFGTGESSLSLLLAFPVAIIKLDKSFVDGIEIDAVGGGMDEARLAVARAVMQMADGLKLDTVAEGIENQAQVDRLLELGYTLGQGFYLARPMAADALGRLSASINARHLAESANTLSR